jgi:hypothetical protein
MRASSLGIASSAVSAATVCVYNRPRASARFTRCASRDPAIRSSRAETRRSRLIGAHLYPSSRAEWAASAPEGATAEALDEPRSRPNPFSLLQRSEGKKREDGLRPTVPSAIDPTHVRVKVKRVFRFAICEEAAMRDESVCLCAA